jgi:hypothetical protein
MSNLINNMITGYALTGNAIPFAFGSALRQEVKNILENDFFKNLFGEAQINTDDSRNRNSVADALSLAISAGVLAKVGVITLSLTPANLCLATAALVGRRIIAGYENEIKQWPQEKKVAIFALSGACFGVAQACAFGLNPVAFAIIFASESIMSQAGLGTSLGNTGVGIYARYLIADLFGVCLFKGKYLHATAILAAAAAEKCYTGEMSDYLISITSRLYTSKFKN